MLHTSWKHWALTLGSATVIVMIMIGYGHVVAAAANAAIDAAWWIVRPLGAGG